MKIPKAFLLNGKVWRVKYATGMKDADGEADQSTRTIYISRNLPKEDKLNTFLHEFIHAALFEIHLSGPSDVLDKNTEEIICTGLADILERTFELKLKKEAKP